MEIKSKSYKEDSVYRIQELKGSLFSPLKLSSQSSIR